MAEITRIITVEFTEVRKNQESEDCKAIIRNIEDYFKSWHCNIFDNIKVTKVQQFIFHDQQKPKLTKREKEFCEFMKCGWIARDKNGSLYWFNSKPSKYKIGWSNIKHKYVCLDLLNAPFTFIQWEDDEPWDVSELRKLEVEE